MCAYKKPFGLSLSKTSNLAWRCHEEKPSQNLSCLFAWHLSYKARPVQKVACARSTPSLRFGRSQTRGNSVTHPQLYRRLSVRSSCLFFCPATIYECAVRDPPRPRGWRVLLKSGEVLSRFRRSCVVLLRTEPSRSVDGFIHGCCRGRSDLWNIQAGRGTVRLCFLQSIRVKFRYGGE